MKVLVLLAVFTACNAYVLRQDQPKNHLDMVKDAFWDYVAKATLTTDEALEMIKQSELGQEVNARISQSADAVTQYTMALRTQTSPLTLQDLLTKLSHEAEQLKAHLEKDLSTVKTKLQPYTEELRADLQSQLEELRRDATPYAEAMDPEALRATLLQKSEELKGSLDKGMKELQSKMVPYTEELKQKMDEFQRSVV